MQEAGTSTPIRRVWVTSRLLVKYPGQQCRREKRNIHSQSAQKKQSQETEQVTVNSWGAFSLCAGLRLHGAGGTNLGPTLPAQTSGRDQGATGKSNTKGTMATY